MITRLIWTIWTPMLSVPQKADKLNLSLSIFCKFLMRQLHDFGAFKMTMKIMDKTDQYQVTTTHNKVWTMYIIPVMHCPCYCSLGVVSLMFHELSKIISRKYTMPQITFTARISSWKFVSVWTGFGHTCTNFQLEILIRSTISAIHKFRENILESSRNVSETTPRSHPVTQAGSCTTCIYMNYWYVYGDH